MVEALATSPLTCPFHFSKSQPMELIVQYVGVRAWLAVAMVATLGSVVGCSGGGDGPTRYRASGNVSFDGQPVADGSVYFMPAKGNSGPQGFAPIKNGKYDTKDSEGNGTVGGAHTVRIVTPRFEYQSKTPVDLPKADSDHPFELKKNEVKPIVSGGPA